MWNIRNMSSWVTTDNDWTWWVSSSWQRKTTHSKQRPGHWEKNKVRKPTPVLENGEGVWATCLHLKLTSQKKRELVRNELWENGRSKSWESKLYWCLCWWERALVWTWKVMGWEKQLMLRDQEKERLWNWQQIQGARWTLMCHTLNCNLVVHVKHRPMLCKGRTSWCNKRGIIYSLALMWSPCWVWVH